MGWVNPPSFGRSGDYSNISSYAIGSTVPLSWQNTPGPLADLWLRCDGEQFTCPQLNLGKTYCQQVLSAFTPSQTSFTWSVQIPNANSSLVPAIWFLDIRPHKSSSSSTGDSILLSQYFNILPAGSVVSTSSQGLLSTTTTSSSSSATSSASLTSSSLSSSSTSPSASPSSLSSTTSSAASSTGLSTTTKAALGASIGLGLCLMILIALAIYYLRRKQASNESHQDHREDSHTNYPEKVSVDYNPVPMVHELRDTKPYATYHARDAPAELHGYESRR